MAAISTAVSTNTVLCPTVDLPAGVFFVSSVPTFMSTRPTSCTKNGLVQGQEIWWRGRLHRPRQGAEQYHHFDLADSRPQWLHKRCGQCLLRDSWDDDLAAFPTNRERLCFAWKH